MGDLAGDHAVPGGEPRPGRRLVVTRERLLDEVSLDCPERGYLLVPAALQALDAGEGAQAYELFRQVAEIAGRFDDADLTVMGVLGRGQALFAMGETERGVAMLDETMVAVTTGDVSPMMAGIAYCAVIIACRAVFDLRRAQEWTAVLSRWCSDQQDLRPYRGQCQVHRSEIMQLRGEWPEAQGRAAGRWWCGCWWSCRHRAESAAGEEGRGDAGPDRARLSVGATR
ncbi:hypothetical protein BH23ACT8_BH23ACT8_07930 [soil metagenome]